MLREIVGEDVHLLVVDLGSVFLHRDDDVAPLRARVEAAKLRHLSEVVAGRARLLENPAAFALRQVVGGQQDGARQDARPEANQPTRYRITIVAFRFGERPTLMRVTSFRAATSTTTTESVFSVAM